MFKEKGELPKDMNEKPPLPDSQEESEEEEEEEEEERVSIGLLACSHYAVCNFLHRRRRKRSP